MTTLTTALFVSSLLLAGCGDDDEPGSDPTSTPTSSSSPTGSTSPEPSDGPEPAAGPVVDTSLFSVHVPDGWRVTESSPDFSITASDRRTSDIIAFQLIDAGGNAFSLDELAQQSLTYGVWTKKPRVAAETTLAGEPAYHLTGPIGGGSIVDVRGSLYGGRSVEVVFRTSESQRHLEATVESVLASWQWK